MIKPRHITEMDWYEIIYDAVEEGADSVGSLSPAERQAAIGSKLQELADADSQMALEWLTEASDCYQRPMLRALGRYLQSTAPGAPSLLLAHELGEALRAVVMEAAWGWLDREIDERAARKAKEERYAK